MESFLLFILLGIIIGTLGTLIGVGGGFILVPILLFIFPDQTPETITSVSLAVVFFNAMSGSFAYSKMKRIDYRSGLIFSLATIPGAIFGALTISYINKSLFNLIFGILLIAGSVFLFFRKDKKISGHYIIKKDQTLRTLIDHKGEVHTFSFSMTTGIVISLFVGYLSSMLGIGGGIVHVPMMVHILNYPVHFATATSHFILAIMAFVGTIVHIIEGSFENMYSVTIAIAIGVLGGAQLGARLSNILKGNWIIRGLAIALGFVGVRILIMSFY